MTIAFLRDLTPLRGDVHLRFALHVALTHLGIALAEDADGLNAWIHDSGQSWAVLSAVAGGRTIPLQGGPRRLADELEAAWDMWLELGGPDPYDFGMTVTDSGTTQYAWAEDPTSALRWSLT
ncbi:hypothetical protein ACF1BE_13450 [Streptomyces sp. NPDC014991]|uniref:hypothetical protein n=1 Tax=Streptomyces sp. NPDC014991 TaxID=3364935 RepID=UPI0036F78C20